MQAGRLINTKHDIHVLYSLTDSTLEEVVDTGSDEELIVNLVDMYETLVRIDDLLEVERLVNIMRELRIFVELLIAFDDLLQRLLRLYDLCGEDATGKVTAIGDEVNGGIEITLYLTQALADLRHMLVHEGLIDAEVVITPGEMGRGTGFHARSRTSRDGVDTDIFIDEAHMGGREKSELNTGSETTGIGDMPGLRNTVVVDLRKTIDKVMAVCRRMLCGGYRCRCQTEVLCQINDLHTLRDLMLAEECLTLAVTETEEDNIDIVKRQLVGEPEGGVAIESFVDIRDEVTTVALGVGKDNLCLRMVDEQPDELTAGIAGGTKYSYFDHSAPPYSLS